MSVLVSRPATLARSAVLASFFWRGHQGNSKLIQNTIGNRKTHPLVVHNLPSHRCYSTMSSIERVTDKLEAPALDDRSYRVIRLSNKLQALLVHDPETDKASASVNVNVGSFSDADDMPGMAHAVEHLLFMGTEKVRRY